MSFLLSVVILMAGVSVATAGNPDSGSLPKDCHLNQVKANPRNPHSFYWCLSDGPVLMKCVDSLVFDPQASKCVTKKSYTKRHNKLANYQEHKSKISGQAISSLKKPAAPGTPFNFTAVPSISSKELQSAAAGSRAVIQCPLAVRYGLDAPTFYRRHPHSCHEFYVCSHGKALRFECPHGLTFNSEKNVCDWVRNVPECIPPEWRIPQKGKGAEKTVSKKQRISPPLKLVMS